MMQISAIHKHNEKTGQCGKGAGIQNTDCLASILSGDVGFLAMLFNLFWFSFLSLKLKGLTICSLGPFQHQYSLKQGWRTPGPRNQLVWPCQGIRSELIKFLTKYNVVSSKLIILYGPGTMLSISIWLLTEKWLPTSSLKSQVQLNSEEETSQEVSVFETTHCKAKIVSHHANNLRVPYVFQVLNT